MAHGGGGTRGGKIRTIITVVVILMIIALVIFWIITGGPQRAWDVGKNFTNPIAFIFGSASSSAALIKLPWQPADVRGPDISDYVQAADQQNEANATPAPDTQSAPEPSQYGTVSPYQGEVVIAGDNLSADPAQEYIELQAASTNAAPIEISGWTLQSSVSGREGFIPQVSPAQVVLLSPGQMAYILTNASPAAALAQNAWRLSVSMRTSPWNPEHDTIRLLDNEQRVVDVLSY